MIITMFKQLKDIKKNTKETETKSWMQQGSQSKVWKKNLAKDRITEENPNRNDAGN